MAETMQAATTTTTIAAVAAEALSSDTVVRTPLVAIDEEGEPESNSMRSSSRRLLLPPADEQTEPVVQLPILSLETMNNNNNNNSHHDDNDSCCCTRSSTRSHAATETTSLANHTITTTTTTTTKSTTTSPLVTKEKPKEPFTSFQQHKKCRICARLGYRPRYAMQSLVFHSMEVLDIDFGMFELVRRINEDHDYRVDQETAMQTVDMTSKRIKHLRNKLAQAGLLLQQQQQQHGHNFIVGESSRDGRVMAPFDKSEIQVGRLLGSGGLSSVYEVELFQPDQVLSAGVTQQELTAREFLANHTMQHPEINPQRMSHRYRKKPSNNTNAPIAQYVIKHLKHTLTSHPERFQRAALDLVLEGQLLSALNHSAIISIRGWSYHGPNAFRTGKHSDYFLILDRLPETLDSRIHEWRQQYCRYRRRRRLQWQRAKYTAKFDRLFQERIQVLLDVASALLYLHDRRIINRDVKTSNIGFDVHGHVKIFDFGLARLLPDEENAVQDGNYSMSRVGTKLYMAPEVRQKQPYTLSADVYSFGIVLWEILTLSSTPKKPRGKKLHDNDNNDIWLPVCRCWPADLQELIRSCLSHDPTRRPSMAQVCDILQKYSATTVVRKPYQRRRSTLRIDLSELSKEPDKVNAAAFEDHGSGESKTSRTSTTTYECPH